MKTRTIIKDQNGATVVEFALILPLLILLLFGIIEFSLLLYNQHVITNAAREGARYGIIVRIPRVPNDGIEEIDGIDGIRTKVKDYARSHLYTFGSDTLEDDHIIIAPMDDNDPDNGPCKCDQERLDLIDENGIKVSNPEERCLTFGCNLVVIVKYDYDFLVLSSPYFGFGQKTLMAVSVMRME